MKKLGSSLVLATSVMLAHTASAATINVQTDANTQDFTIQPNNDYAPMVGLDGQIGATVVAEGDEPMLLTFEYLFKEAAFTNGFYVGGTQVFNTDTTAFGTTHEMLWEGGAGALDFHFKPDDLDIVTNAGNDANAPANFWTRWDEETGSILIGLDDSGNNNDDDYDDLVVRISAADVAPEPGAEVPEPATLALLGMGVVGLSLSRRNKK